MSIGHQGNIICNTKVSWCSWLSHMPHTHRVPGSIPGETMIFDFCPSDFPTLRDAASKTINSRIPYHRRWWRHKKQLPAYSREVVQWWMSNIREPTWEEARDAAQRDDVDMIDLIGWDNSQTSIRHRHLSKPGWSSATLLLEAIAKGSRQTIIACHRREDISQCFSAQSFELMQLWQKLGEEGNLDMMRWICNEQAVDGLPFIVWPDHVSCGSYDCVRDAAKAGHRHVIHWLKERGDIDEYTVDELYKGAAEGGRLDLLVWLGDHGMHCDVTRGEITLDYFAGSLALFEWAVRHNVPHVEHISVYSSALSAGCTEYCFENQFNLTFENVQSDVCLNHENYEAIQLAIDHGYLTRQRQIHFKSTNEQFELIKWLHERNVLHSKFYESAMQNDHLDVLQWAAEKGYFTRSSYDHRIYRKMSVETTEWLMRRSLSTKPSTLGKRHVMDRNIEPMEWMLQRKWKKSEEEVQRWFEREERDHRRVADAPVGARRRALNTTCNTRQFVILVAEDQSVSLTVKYLRRVATDNWPHSLDVIGMVSPGIEPGTLCVLGISDDYFRMVYYNHKHHIEESSTSSLFLLSIQMKHNISEPLFQLNALETRYNSVGMKGNENS
ncbi:hypothetical protein PROFUN_04086 [Planoprotostelium fungivorum]|uniref:Uncharacterized protein n=1 Tax=Planoprotostelium fungivorum TaxID=1890364 RepID=A0A2P6NJF6_9EUKA|nr:hypothetical protein PROFUN_04086 [Planoprotostelium fungivorum]